MHEYDELGFIIEPPTHSIDNRIIIEEINFGERLGTLQLNIYTKDGDIPHFHLDNDEKGVHIAICMEKPEYYYHYNESMHVLTNNEKEILIKKLNEKIAISLQEPERIEKVWYLMCFFHNCDCRNRQIKYPYSKIPNYMKLPEYLVDGYNEHQLPTHNVNNIVFSKEINFGERLGILRMSIYNKDGEVPHFHLDNDGTDGREIHMSISMKTSKYYYHYNESNHRLIKEERKILMKELKQKISLQGDSNKLKPLIFWMKKFWNDGYLNKPVIVNKKIPNYIKLK